MDDRDRREVIERRPEELLGPLNDVERRFAPKLLWVAGHSEFLASGPRVAVVGSRELSPAGAKRTRDVARFLVDQDVLVVSGLAAGADTIAHQTTIEAGGRTVAVLGTPIHACYPTSNRDLQRRIGSDHLLISQFSPRTPVQRGNFVIRNRLMALIADASIIVEAGDSSGTLSQGWEALRLGRQLFILEPVVSDPKLTWPAKMVEYGAVSLPLDRFADVLEALPPPGARLHAGFPA